MLEPNQSTDTLPRTQPHPATVQQMNTALNVDDLPTFLETLLQAVKECGGITAASRQMGVNRTGLYHSLSSDGNPTLSSVLGLLAFCGLRLRFRVNAQ